MAYNEETAHRIRKILIQKDIDFTERKMFSGICFMVDNKMCCGTHIDKKTNEDLLLCRIGEEAYQEAIERNDVIPMRFTGKAMKGFIFVIEAGYKNNKDLAYWLQLCLNFNPKAKSSKNRHNTEKWLVKYIVI